LSYCCSPNRERTIYIVFGSVLIGSRTEHFFM